jgi:hypothetical protein
MALPGKKGCLERSDGRKKEGRRRTIRDFGGGGMSHMVFSSGEIVGLKKK